MRCITAAWKEKKEEEKKNTKINNNVCSICYVMFKDVLENDVKIHTLQQIVLKVKKKEKKRKKCGQWPDVIHCSKRFQFDLIIEFKNMDAVHDMRNSHNKNKNKSDNINDGDDNNDNNSLRF